MLSTTTKTAPSKLFANLVLDDSQGICATATSFADLKRLFKTSGASALLLNTLRSAAPAQPLAESATVLSCCSPEIAELRRSISKFNDLKVLVFSLVADELHRTAAAATNEASAAAAAAAAASVTSKKKQATAVRRQRINAEDDDVAAAATTTKPTPSSAAAPTFSKPTVHFLINAVGLLYGVVFPAAANEQPVACAALVTEKENVESSETYQNSNAAERRKAMLGSVLAVFSDRGQRHFFSRVWTSVLGEVLGYQQQILSASSSNNNSSGGSNSGKGKPALLKSNAVALREQEQEHLRGQLHILSLHLLSDVNNAVLPWLTNPLLLSDSLTKAYSGGGLLAVLALEGLLTLMLQHGLEYPKFYTGLYALVTPDIFSSPHRNRFFRLLHLALTSVRVSAATAASFMKRLARCALICPAPSLYFVLPFIRQKLQQHASNFALIHRSLRDVEEAEVEVEKQIKQEEAKAAKKQQQQQQKKSAAGDNTHQSKKSGSNNVLSAATRAASARVERLKQLFEGVDPFDEKQPDPEKTHAIDSTLWEIATLERHMLPSVRNAVAAFASPAEDHQALQFERSYQRLFAQAMSTTEISSSSGGGDGSGGGGASAAAGADGGVAVRVPRAQAAARSAALQNIFGADDDDDDERGDVNISYLESGGAVAPSKEELNRKAAASEDGKPFGLF